MDILSALTIVFSECRLSLLILHVPHTGDTWEYLDCAMPSTSSNCKSVHDYRFHGDEVFDPRSDLSQGRGDDTEYPMIIPMFTRRDLNYTQLDTRFTRSSLNLHFLHVRHAYYLKYMCYACSGTPKGTMENPRTKAERAQKHERGEGRRASCYSPDIRPHAPDIRLLPKPRTSGPFAGNPAPHHRRQPKPATLSPDIRPEARTSGSSRAAGHLAPARTSGTCLCAENGPRAHVSPSHLPLCGLAL